MVFVAERSNTFATNRKLSSFPPMKLRGDLVIFTREGILIATLKLIYCASGSKRFMISVQYVAPGPDALYSSRHFLAESELKSENSLWKDSTIFLHSFFRLVSFMWL